MNLIPKTLLSAVGATALLTTSYSASLTQNTDLLRSGGGEPAGGLNISVFDGSAAFSYDDGTTTFPTTTMGDGTIVDYAFYNVSGGLNAYAEGSASVIGTASVDASLDAGGDALSGSNSVIDLFTTGGLGGTADFASPDSTMARAGNVSGTIDLSGYASGTVYFFYGTFNDANSVTVTMSGSGQTDIIAGSGDVNVGGNNAFYVSTFNFVTDGLYDSLAYDYINVDADGSRARFGGVVIDAVAIPEPSSFSFVAGILACCALANRRRA